MTQPIDNTGRLTDTSALLGSADRLDAGQAFEKTPKVLYRQPPATHQYVAVGPEDLNGFPDPLGTSEPWQPGSVGLGLGRSSTADGIRLLFHHSDYGKSRHPSRGIAEGVYRRAKPALYHRSGGWTDLSYATNPSTQWIPRSPALPTDTVEYTVWYRITADAAREIAYGESQHVDDFDRAWQLSFRQLQSVIDSLRPAPSETALLGSLTDALIQRKLAYLIPAQPDKAEAWRDQLLSAYAQLCSQSTEARHKARARGRTYNPHQPAGYLVYVDGTDLYLEYEFERLDQQSSRIILPERVELAFPHPDFAAYIGSRTPGGGLAPGTTVTLRSGIKASDLTGRATDIFQRPSLEQDVVNIGDNTEVHKQLTSGGVVVAAGPPGQVWVRIQVGDPGIAGYIGATTGYVPVPTAQLQVKP